jgi:hypothetical protein
MNTQERLRIVIDNMNTTHAYDAHADDARERAIAAYVATIDATADASGYVDHDIERMRAYIALHDVDKTYNETVDQFVAHFTYDDAPDTYTTRVSCAFAYVVVAFNMSHTWDMYTQHIVDMNDDDACAFVFDMLMSFVRSMRVHMGDTYARAYMRDRIA